MKSIDASFGLNGILLMHCDDNNDAIPSFILCSKVELSRFCARTGHWLWTALCGAGRAHGGGKHVQACIGRVQLQELELSEKQPQSPHHRLSGR